MENLKEELIKALIKKLKNGEYVSETEFSLLKFLDNKKGNS